MSITDIQPRRIQKYGWKPDLPDHRDLLFDKVLPESAVPPMFDLWEEGPMPVIYDQGQLGSCTGNGVARVMHKTLMEEGKAAPTDTPSRLFIYYWERFIEGTVDQDSGAEVRDGLKVVAKYGVPSELDWPYDISQFAVKPSDKAIADALKVEALQYQRIIIGSPGVPMRSAISQGHPIVFGFPVPDYFEGNWDPVTQPLPLPGMSPNWIGGHCVTVTGYDFSLTKYNVPVFICDNSWGENWGMKGRFAMHYNWFTPENAFFPLGSDLWIVQKVS